MALAGLANSQPAELDSIWRSIELEDVVVTAQYAPTHVRNAVHQVKVIQAADIQEQGQNNLAEVLTNQLNLRVNTDPILGAGLRIQGVGGQNVQIMIDGVPIIGRVNGNIDLSQINLNNIDRIEIIEGAMSAQFGSNAAGGVVNIITKKSQLERWRLESVHQYENAGIWNNALTAGARWKRLYASVTLNRFQSQFAPEDSLRLYETRPLPSGGTFRTKKIPWNPKVQYGLDGMLRYNFSDSSRLVYQYRHFDEVVSNFGEVRRPRFRPYAFDEFYTTIRQDHSLDFETFLKDRYYLKSTTAYNRYGRFTRRQRLDFETGAETPLPEEQDSARFTALLHRSMISAVSSGSLNGQFGLELLHETGRGDRIVDSTAAPFDQARLTNFAAWAGLQYQPVASLTLLFNLRYGYNSKYEHPLIPALHVNWRAKDRSWGLKASYAHGFRAPSLKELHFNFIDVNHFIVGNPNLRAERSRNLSLMAEGEHELTFQHRLSGSAKLFYNRIEDRIVLAEFAGAQFNYQNLEDFETHGINLQLQYEYDDNLSLRSGFAYTRLYNFWSETFNADRYTGLSEWQNDLSYTLPLLESRLVVTHRYIGREIRFFENGEGELEQGFIGDYHLMNVSLSRDFWQKHLFLSLGAKNLLDTQAVPALGGGGGGAHSGGNGGTQLLNWGRTYFVRLNLRLGGP